MLQFTEIILLECWSVSLIKEKTGYLWPKTEFAQIWGKIKFGVGSRIKSLPKCYYLNNPHEPWSRNDVTQMGREIEEFKNFHFAFYSHSLVAISNFNYVIEMMLNYVCVCVGTSNSSRSTHSSRGDAWRHMISQLAPGSVGTSTENGASAGANGKIFEIAFSTSWKMMCVGNWCVCKF